MVRSAPLASETSKRKVDVNESQGDRLTDVAETSNPDVHHLELGRFSFSAIELSSPTMVLQADAVE